MPTLVVSSSPSEWIGNTWSWAVQHLQAFETLGVILAAVLAFFALVSEARRRRLDQFTQLTDVAAWAEPVDDKPTAEVGVSLSVRNGTGQALQMTHVMIWPRDAKPPFPVPVSVALVPPHDTSTFKVRPGAFAAWNPRIRHRQFLVAVRFQDARGRWWWRLPNGRVLRHAPMNIAQEPSLENRWPGWPLWWRSFRTRAVRRLKRAATWRPK